MNLTVVAYIVALALLVVGTVLVIFRNPIAAWGDARGAKGASRPLRPVVVLWMGVGLVVLSAPIGAAVILQLRSDGGTTHIWANILVVICAIVAPIGLASLMPLARERARRDPGSVVLPAALGVLVGTTIVAGTVLIIGMLTT